MFEFSQVMVTVIEPYYSFPATPLTVRFERTTPEFLEYSAPFIAVYSALIFDIKFELFRTEFTLFFAH